MPNIFSDGGTLILSGILTWPKSTVNASHHTPKWPISNTVKSPGNVSTTVFLSYLTNGDSRPFSSGIRTPFDDGFGPRPTQNLASVNDDWLEHNEFHVCLFIFCKLYCSLSILNNNQSTNDVQRKRVTYIKCHFRKWRNNVNFNGKVILLSALLLTICYFFMHLTP